ncbi:MAG TPA: family 10 glycosylhydrolase [Verrucomicrobiae bacterium]|nr:family 10 glycosylhydrolase [Verrucomicrobiae bacterium]
MKTSRAGLLAIAVAAIGSVAAGRAAQTFTYEPSSEMPPNPMREMRAAWVATVANIDWPSTNNLSTARQKAELVAIFDRAAHLKLNTIIFQVRPTCDALYASSIEPWSEYLTGTMGKPPEPFYDPLTFAIEEAHKRGLELHAWFNPYRARQALAKSPIAPNHVSRTHPQMVRQYGKSLWLDPGEKEVQAYSLRVVMDVVRRYDIDGVHFDDYFYPYKEQDASGKELDFPDGASWRKYGQGGKLNREDWRRENVDSFIHAVYQSIKAAKPWVKFGISPFGIWRPHNPPQIQGFDPYEKLYADSRKWLMNGWVDYFAPQLYWGIEPPEQSFPVLLRWWAGQNTKGRLLAPGLDTTKVGRRWKPEEIIEQIRLTRRQPGVGGHVHWDMKALMRNEALDAALEREVYAQPALVPSMPWLESARPQKPALTIAPRGGEVQARWGPATQQKAWLWLLQTRTGQNWTTRILPGWEVSCALGQPLPTVIALRALDRFGNLSEPLVLRRRN